MENILPFPGKKPVQSMMRHAKGNIYLLQWQERDDHLTQDVFYFLLVPSAKITAFEQVAGKAPFTLADYGHVLHWGYGEPDESDMARVQSA